MGMVPLLGLGPLAKIVVVLLAAFIVITRTAQAKSWTVNGGLQLSDVNYTQTWFEESGALGGGRENSSAVLGAV